MPSPALGYTIGEHLATPMTVGNRPDVVKGVANDVIFAVAGATEPTGAEGAVFDFNAFVESQPNAMGWHVFTGFLFVFRSIWSLWRLHPWRKGIGILPKENEKVNLHSVSLDVEQIIKQIEKKIEKAI